MYSSSPGSRKRKPDGYKNTEAVSGNMRKAWIEEEGEYMDLYTGKKVSLQAIKMEGHSFVLAKKC